MNFKNIVCVSLLAILSSVNAAPITSGTKTIPSSLSGTKSLPTSTNSITESKYEEINILNNNCKTPSGLPLDEENENGVTYSCLRIYSETRKNNKVTPENSACLYSGERIYCVDDEVSNIEECSKSSDKYDYDTCMTKVSYLIDSTKNFTFVDSLRTYPKKEMINPTIRKDYNECSNKNGIILPLQTEYQYICLTPEEKQTGLFDKHCQSIDGTTYCVEEENSNIDLCNKSSNGYNFEKCLNLLLRLGKIEHINIV